MIFVFWQKLVAVLYVILYVYSIYIYIYIKDHSHQYKLNQELAHCSTSVYICMYSIYDRSTIEEEFK